LGTDQRFERPGHSGSTDVGERIDDGERLPGSGNPDPVIDDASADG